MSADDSPSPPPEGGPVVLSVPLQAQYAATVRTMAASLGADAGFSVDELDDIRLALSEVFSAMGDEVDPAARAQVSFSIDTGSIHIDVRTDRPSTTIDLDELALGILRSVTDEFDATPTGVRLVKHATEAIAGSSSS